MSDPTEAALLHAGCAESLIVTLSSPETVQTALETLRTLSNRWQADYDAVCTLDSELIPRRAAASWRAVSIGPHICTTAHRAGVMASWVLERMVRHALLARSVYRADKQRYESNLDQQKPFDFQLAKDFSEVITRATRRWKMPELKGLTAEIEYESAWLSQPARGEESGTSSSSAEGEQAEGIGERIRQQKIANLPRAIRRAFLAFEAVARKKEKRLEDLEDHEALKLLKEEGVPDDADDRGELIDYKPPKSVETFRKYLSIARRALGELKYTSRRGRAHGKSIARQGQIEPPHNDDE
jgi:hypothetical protein